MKTIKKLMMFAAVLLCGGAWAVESPTPVVYWNGDFKTDSKTGTNGDIYALKINGNSVATDVFGSTITIADTERKGVYIDWNTTIDAATIIVKYSGLTTPANVAYPIGLVGFSRSGCANNDGLTIHNSNRQVKAYWNNTYFYSGGDYAIDMDKSEATLALKYSSGGTYARTNQSGSWAQLYSHNGVKGGGTYALNGAVVGGSRAATIGTTNFTVPTGMKIIAVAIFNSALSDDEIAAYVFPNDYRVTIGETTYSTLEEALESNTATAETPIKIYCDQDLPSTITARTYYIDTNGHQLNTPKGLFSSISGVTVTVASTAGDVAEASMIWDRDFTSGRVDKNGYCWSFYDPTGVSRTTTGATVGSGGGVNIVNRTKNPTGLSGMATVIFRAKNIALPSSGSAVLARLKQGDTTLGASLTNNNGAGYYTRVWTDNNLDWSSRHDQPAVFASPGVEQTYVLAYEYDANQTKGTYFYRVDGERTVTKLWNEGGLESSGINAINEISILGKWNGNSCNGATLTGLAIFEGTRLTEEGIANFNWSSPAPNKATYSAEEATVTHYGYIPSTATLIWPGLTLNDIKDRVFAGTMNGAWVAADNNAGSGTIGGWANKATTVEKTVSDDAVVLDFKADGQDKYVRITLSNSADGVTAVAAAGTTKGGTNSTLATDDTAQAYGIKVLKASKPVAKVNGTGYLTLTEAIAAADDNGEVELLLSTAEAVTLGKNIKINVASGSELTISGTVTVGETYTFTKTGAGTLSVTSDSNSFSGVLTVAKGELVCNTADRGLGGTQNIEAGAMLTSMRASDSLHFDATTETHVHGTLNLEGARWSLRAANKIYLYPGAKIVGANSNGTLDNIADNQTSIYVVKDGANGGTVTLETDIRFRSAGLKVGIDIVDGMTVSYANPNGFRVNAGNLVLSGNGTFTITSDARLNNLSSISVGENVTITNAGNATCAIKGSGTVVYDGTVPEAATLTTNAYTANDWTGTVWLKNIGQTGNSMLIDGNRLQSLGHSGSTVKFTGCNGYIVTSTDNLGFDVEVDGTGWKNPSGGSSWQRNFGALKGDGIFDGRSLTTSNFGQCSELETFTNAESFAGDLLLGKVDAVGDDRAGKRVIIGTYNGMPNSQGNLGIGEGKALSIAAGKKLNAKNVFVKGTLNIAATATIDVANIKITSKAGKIVSGQALTVVGDVTGYDLVTTKDNEENPTLWTYTLVVHDIEEEVSTAVSNQRAVDAIHIGATGTQKFTGLGSLVINDLVMRNGAKIVFDPVRTPIKLTTVPTISSGATIELTSSWANHSDEYSTIDCGKIRLLTYPNTGSLTASGITIAGLKKGVAYSLEEEPVTDAALKQLVLYIGNYKTAATPIKLTQFGDSITEGIWRGTASENYIGTPNYRIPLMHRLEAHGYSPTTGGFRGDDLKNGTVYGSSDANGVPADPKYRLHNGISAQRVYTGSTSGDDRAGFAEGIEAYLEASGDGQDVITLKIGTNDILGGETGANVFEGWLDIVKRLVAKRPSTRIVVTPIIKSSSANSNVNGAEADAYNNAIANAIATNADINGHVFSIDARTAVGSSSGSFLGDGIHPNWVGHNNMADAWFVGVTNAFAKSTGKQYEPHVTTGAAANIPAAYRKGFVKLATMDLAKIKTDIGSWGTTPYTEYNSAMADKTLTKVAYYVERSTSTSANNQFVWVDMDSWASSKNGELGNTLANMGIPKDAQSNLLVNNLHVYSNLAEIRKVEPTTGGVKGTLLFTNNGCGAAGGVSGAPDSKFGMDWNDSLNNLNYGVMVVSRIYEDAVAITHRYALGQTLFSYNGFNNNIKNILGIGDFALHCKQSVGNSSMGTFTLNWISPSDTPTRMTSDYLDHGVIEIWGVPEGYVVPDSDEGVEVTADDEAGAIAAAQILPDTEAETAAGSAATRTGYLTFKATRVGESNNWKVQAVVDNAKLPENKKIDDTAVAFANAGGIVKLAGATEKQTIQIPAASVTPGLYYSVSFGTSPDNHTQESERVLATSGEGTVDIPVPALGNEKVYYIKVKASATR